MASLINNVDNDVKFIHMNIIHHEFESAYTIHMIGKVTFGQIQETRAAWININPENIHEGFPQQPHLQEFTSRFQENLQRRQEEEEISPNLIASEACLGFAHELSLSKESTALAVQQLQEQKSSIKRLFVTLTVPENYQYDIEKLRCSVECCCQDHFQNIEFFSSDISDSEDKTVIKIEFIKE